MFLFTKLINTIMSSLKGLLKNIWQFFSQWWGVAEKFVKDNVHTAVIVVENLKSFIDNPIGDFLLSVIDDKIPGDVTGKVKEILPKILLALHIVDDCKDMDQENALKCIASKLQLLSDDTKDMLYHSLAALLAKELSDGKLSFSDAIAVVEWYYTNKVKKQ
jgi:hypothetical protein